MNKHLEKAIELRNAEPMITNCAQAVLLAYSDELGISEETARKLGSNFAGGMKFGSVCGAITGAYMVLGLKGISTPQLLTTLKNRISESREGCVNCFDLLKIAKERGETKKAHCDALITDAISLIDELTE